MVRSRKGKAAGKESKGDKGVDHAVGTASPPALEVQPLFGPDSATWAPSSNTALRLLLLVRLTGAILSPIMDCDETFNYWEPLHFLMYGRGLQTWEYAPQFALRSYGYIWPHAAAVYTLGGALGVSKPTQFSILRTVLATITALCEVYLYEGLQRRFGRALARLSLLFTVLSVGMWHAAPAFLPSSFAMQATAVAYGAWLRGPAHWPLAVAVAAASVLLGWPFAGLVFLPLGLHVLAITLAAMLGKVRVGQSPAGLLGGVVLAGVAGVVLPAAYGIGVDAVHYGGAPLLAVWNIIKYNVLGQGGGGRGSELYGVEPVSYYVKNLLLNWSIAAPAAAAALPLLLLLWLVGAAAGARQGGTRPGQRLLPPPSTLLPRWLRGSPQASHAAVLWGAVALWVGFMASRPHKEERFLFPVFGLIPPLAAFALLTAQRLAAAGTREACGTCSLLPTVVLGVFALLALGRAALLVAGYGGALNAWHVVHHVVLGGWGEGRALAKAIAGQVPMVPLALGAMLGWRTGNVSTATGGLNGNATFHAARTLAGWGAPPRGAAWWLPPAAMDHAFHVAVAGDLVPGGDVAGRWVGEAGLPGLLPPAPVQPPAEGMREGHDWDTLTARGHSAYYGGRACLGKEWYRLPSHHFAPGVTAPGLSDLPPRHGMPPRTPGGPLQIAFVQGGFGGHLPQMYLHPLRGGTAAQVSGFNDENKGSPWAFVHPDTCDVVVDLHLPGETHEGEPWFQDAGPANQQHVANEEWVSVWSGRFLLPDRAAGWSRLLYIPGLSEAAWERTGAAAWYRVMVRRDVAQTLAPHALEGKPPPTG